MKHFLLAAGLLSLAGACIVKPIAAQTLRPFGHLAAGQAAPAFRLMDKQGKAIALQDLRGKVVYVDFWGSWCKPCLAEMPAAAKLRQQFLGRQVTFVYIANETSVDYWKATIDQRGLDSLGAVNLIDPNGSYAARPYGVHSWPTYVLIGRDGRIILPSAPHPSDGRLAKQALEAALAER